MEVSNAALPYIMAHITPRARQALLSAYLPTLMARFADGTLLGPSPPTPPRHTTGSQRGQKRKRKPATRAHRKKARNAAKTRSQQKAATGDDDFIDLTLL